MAVDYVGKSPISTGIPCGSERSGFLGFMRKHLMTVSSLEEWIAVRGIGCVLRFCVSLILDLVQALPSSARCV